MQTVSVIVPAYNVEKYIYKCIKSICDQDYTYLDIVIIIDGGIDSTERICREIALNDTRVRIITQDHRGLIEARKRGLREAKGELVLYVDGDDWIEKEYISRFVYDMERSHADLIVSNSVSLDFKDESRIDHCAVVSALYGKHDMVNIIYPRLVYDEINEKAGIFAFLVGKLFNKRDLIRQYQRIDFDIRLGEDGAVSFPLIAESDVVSVIDNPGYHYVQRNDSMSTSLTLDDMSNLEKLKDYFARCVSSSSHSDVLIRQFKIYVRDLVIRTVKAIYDIDVGKILCSVPYEILKKDGEVVIYGAGKVGREYVKSILKSRYSKITGWLDRNNGQQIYGIRIYAPQDVIKLSYDQVLIAIDNREYADLIRKDLVSYGVEDKDIIWAPVCWG